MDEGRINDFYIPDCQKMKLGLAEHLCNDSIKSLAQTQV